MSREIFLIDCSYPYLISKDSAHTSVIVRRVQELLGNCIHSIYPSRRCFGKQVRFYFISSFWNLSGRPAICPVPFGLMSLEGQKP